MTKRRKRRGAQESSSYYVKAALTRGEKVGFLSLTKPPRVDQETRPRPNSSELSRSAPRPKLDKKAEVAKAPGGSRRILTVLRDIMGLVLVVALFALVIGGCVAWIYFCCNLDENSWFVEVLYYLACGVGVGVVFFLIAGISTGKITPKDMLENGCYVYSDEDFEDWF